MGQAAASQAKAISDAIGGSALPSKFPSSFTSGAAFRNGPSSTMDFMPDSCDVPKEVDPVMVSPLATTQLPSAQLPASTIRNVHIVDSRSRDWGVNSVLEVLSVSKSRWYVGYVLTVHAGEYDSQLLTVRFWDETNDAKQKNIQRNDSTLTHVGVHTAGQLPPGFKQQQSSSRPGSFSYLDTATGVKYSSPETAWNVHFQRLRDIPQADIPHDKEDNDVVPRRNPTAIADGLAVDVAPPLPSMCSPTKPGTQSPDGKESAADRWRSAKSECVAHWNQAAEDKKKAEADRLAQLDAKAKRASNQPERGCPIFKHDLEASPSDRSRQRERSQPGESRRERSQPARERSKSRETKRMASTQPPRACPTFSPAHLDEVPVSHRSRPGSVAGSSRGAPAYAAAMSGLIVDEVVIGSGAFDPAHPAVLDKLKHNVGITESRPVSIEDSEGFRGGLNEGVWFLGKHVLKLVKSGRRHPSHLSETENLIRLHQECSDVCTDRTLSFPVAIFTCLGSAKEKRYELIVMKMASGTKLATLIAMLWNNNQQPKTLKLLERVGKYLAAFQAKYGSSMHHGDFHPSNIFYDEATDVVTLIDLADLGLPASETDAAHFEASLRLLGRSFGPLFESEGIRAFRSGYRK